MAGVLANKASFFMGYLNKHRELSKCQREYKKVLNAKLKSRKEAIFEASRENAIEKLEEEKDELRAQIWVASGKTHFKQNQQYLKLIKCHVDCQENLADEINTLKAAIVNMDREISRVGKRTYDLNRLIIPDQQHQAHVAKTRKQIMILENALEVSVRQECSFTANNAELREQIIRILNYRSYFNDSFVKMVQKLNSDKKYLIDMINYVVNPLEGFIDLYEKGNSLHKRETKDRELRKIEMQGVMRKKEADADNSAFLDCKRKSRDLADIQPKEYKRRDEFRRQHNKKINLYKSVLQRILIYTQSRNLYEVIDKFQQQESLYYSFFNYANKMSYHITLLNNSVNRLFDDITAIKEDNNKKTQKQLEVIETLEDQLQEKQKSKDLLLETRRRNDERLENLLQGVETLYQMAMINSSPLSKLVDDHTHVNLVNVRRFLKILETRILEIIACVYVTERQDEDQTDYIVKQVEKICEMPTHIDDIVLTQQCPECAEGEAFNMDDGGDVVAIHTICEIKNKLYEKITQPEMQYRLHSLSQCRLPRSRKLTAKRHL